MRGQLNNSNVGYKSGYQTNSGGSNSAAQSNNASNYQSKSSNKVNGTAAAGATNSTLKVTDNSKYYEMPKKLTNDS
jgi:hypothetical protein